MQSPDCVLYRPRREKTSLRAVWPSKAQPSLFSYQDWRLLKLCSKQSKANNKGFDQTAWMCRLVYIFVRNNKFSHVIYHSMRVKNFLAVNVLRNTFLFLFSNKMLVFRAGIHKMLVRIANREDPDQTASSEAVWYGSALFVRQQEFEILEHLPKSVKKGLLQNQNKLHPMFLYFMFLQLFYHSSSTIFKKKCSVLYIMFVLFLSFCQVTCLSFQGIIPVKTENFHPTLKNQAFVCSVTFCLSRNIASRSDICYCHILK